MCMKARIFSTQSLLCILSTPERWPRRMFRSVTAKPQLSANSWSATRHENCDIHALSMTWPDLPVDGRSRLYSLQKNTKNTSYICAVVANARFAAWNLANWHENQIEIRSKTRAELVASYSCQSRCTILWSSHARATFSAAAGLPVCRPCSVNLHAAEVGPVLNKTTPVLVRKSGNSSNNFLAL